MSHYERPEVLVGLDLGKPAVIEASAGTGKTHTLEHLVVELIAEQGARIDEILVVTFTEKAAGELRTRIRDKLTSLVAEPAEAPSPQAVRLDEAARSRLRAALADFDRATITTLHGYCQRVLTEHAFAHRRLLRQARVDERASFEEAFAESMRRDLAVAPAFLPWLSAAFEAGMQAPALSALLWSAHRAPGTLFPKLDEPAFRAVLLEIEAFASRGVRVADVAWPGGIPIARRAAGIEAVLRQHGADLPRLCAGLDAEDEGRKAFADLLGKGVAVARARAAPRRGDDDALVQAYLRLAELRVPFAPALCHALLPPIVARLRAKKAAEGLFDFQDLLGLVDATLHGEDGDTLAHALRARHPYALIDEFQDTDPVQWRIFRRLYVTEPLRVTEPSSSALAHARQETRSPGSIFLVGDPKQAIYSFRGADVRTYFAAREEVTVASGTLRALDTSYRATPALLAAFDALFDGRVQPTFFTGPMGAAPSLRAGKPDLHLTEANETASPLVCWRIDPPAPREGAASPIRIPDAKRAITAALTDEIGRILEGALRFGPRGAQRPIPAREIFVLTRTLDESIDIGDALAQAGLPHAFYKQDGLLQSEEAHAWLELLRGLSRPDERAARLAAWHTPFFGLSLRALAAMEAAPPNHPAWERLHNLRALALRGEWERFFARALDESGVVRRLRFAGGRERTLANLAQVSQVLLAEATRTRTTLPDLEQRLAAFIAGRALPDDADANLERQGRSDDAVQIMTMHKSKGLEATVVFLYGAYGRRPASGLQGVHVDGERVAVFKGGHTAALKAAVAREQDEEDQRLLYVALTRARARVYVAHFPTPPPTLKGAHALLEPHLCRALDAGHATLRELHREPAPRISPRISPPAPAARTQRPSVNEATRPGTDLSDAQLARLVGERAGPVVTSYSRLKQGRAARSRDETPEGFDHDARLSEMPVRRTPDSAAGDLPPGAEVGVFLHALLETCDLSLICSYEHIYDWLAHPARAAQFAEVARAHGRPPHELEPAARLVWAALKTPLRLGAEASTVMDGLAVAPLCIREMEFLLTFPRSERAGHGEQGEDFVKGFVDVVFAYQGLTYILDWKSDVLPDYDAGSLADHVGAAYRLQGLLYVLATSRALGIQDARDYDGRVGGFVYCFLRGMDGATSGRGTYFERPTFDELRAFERALADSGPLAAPEGV